MRRTLNGKPTRTFYSWKCMRSRCTNPTDINFHGYGGRGIRVCERWLSSFDNFVEDMGLRPEGKTLDRINNEGNYEPSNCRWASPKQQQRNRRFLNKITYQGQTLTALEWQEKTGISSVMIYRRWFRGWPVDRIFSMPNTKTRHDENRFRRSGQGNRVFIAFEGKTMDFQQWAAETGLASQTIYIRWKRGWPVSDILKLPNTKKCRATP